MLCDGGDKFSNREDLVVPLRLRVNFVTLIDDGVVFFVLEHLLEAKGISNDVASGPFKREGLIWAEGMAGVHTEARVPPGKDTLGPFLGKKIVIEKHLDDPDTEEFFEGFQVGVWGHDGEGARVGKKAVRHECVQVGMKILQELAKGLDRALAKPLVKSPQSMNLLTTSSTTGLKYPYAV